MLGQCKQKHCVDARYLAVDISNIALVFKVGYRAHAAHQVRAVEASGQVHGEFVVVSNYFNTRLGVKPLNVVEPLRLRGRGILGGVDTNGYNHRVENSKSAFEN